MKHDQHRIGWGEFWSAISDVIVAFGRVLLSALAYIVAGMIVGAVGGAAVSLYAGAGLLPGVLVGAALGFIVVVAVQAMVASGGGW